MQVDRTQQRAITRLCIQCGLFLLQHGAESALVEELSTRLGLALGMDSVESAISSNAIVLTTIKNGECLTSTRKNVDRGINMLSLIHISEPTRLGMISYAVFCLKKKKKNPSTRDRQKSRMTSSA